MKRRVTLSVVTLAASAMVHPANATPPAFLGPPLAAPPGTGFHGVAVQPGPPSGDPGLHGFHGVSVLPGPPGGDPGLHRVHGVAVIPPGPSTLIPILQGWIF